MSKKPSKVVDQSKVPAHGDAKIGESRGKFLHLLLFYPFNKLNSNVYTL